MAIEAAQMATFNRGIIDRKALGRVDIKRIALSAEVQTNWIARTLGSMTLRPGMEKIISHLGDKPPKMIPFIFGTNDTALCELTGGKMRVLIDDQLVQRPTVNTTILNGTFDSDLTSWTDADESGATSAFLAGGYMSLKGTRFNSAIRRQEVSVSTLATSSPGMVRAERPLLLSREGRVIPIEPAGSVQPAQTTGVPEHALKIVVQRGPVTLKVGSIAGEDDYVATVLGTGNHSLAFNPKGNFFVEFSQREEYEVLVDSVVVETGGDMIIDTPWDTVDMFKLRWTQSADVMFVAGDPDQQYKIERRNKGRSWSVVKYETEDGPFRSVNIGTTTITSDALSGEATLTASKDLFNSGHVGSLFRLRSVGQKVSADITAEGNWTDAIRVVGVGTSRKFEVDITGTWTATVTLQRSIDDESSWTDVITYTTNQDTTHSDSLDNVIAFYRLGVDTDDFTSGTATCTLEWSGGGISGVARIHTFTSATSVKASIVKRMGQTTATNEWSEGIWSTFRGWPTAVVLYEGRLWWTGHDWIIGSVSDAFASFDDDVEGDSGPIIRTIASGPVDIINWLLALQRLIIGTEGSEISARASAFDELLTPSEFNIKEASTLGSAPLNPVKVDARGLFVAKSQFRLYDLNFDFGANDYIPTDLSMLVPNIGSPGFVHMVVQRYPDTRILVLRSDGTVAMLVYDPAEEVRCWLNVETGDADGVNGVIEDSVILPEKEEDQVYYSVLRIIDGKQHRFLEKMAKESECVGGTLNKQADSFIEFHQEASSTINVPHLIGESVVVWADGKCLRDTDDEIATFTVDSSGNITVTNDGSSYSASDGIAGLGYTAQFKSAKLPYGATNLTAVLGKRQRISEIGFLLENTHHLGLEYGRDFDNMDNLPQVIEGTTVSADTIHSFIEEGGIAFPGETDTNIRLALQAKAPRPATVIASPIEITTKE